MKYGFFDEKELQSPNDPHKSPFPHVVRDELLNLLNRIRREWGKPVIVNSGYRSPEYNARLKVPCRIRTTRKAWRRTFDRMIRL